jgi:ABC-type multidrug transport system fused ATPase/permease subunit
MIWSSPLQISLSIFLLWKYLGAASLAGLAIMMTAIPLNVIFTRHTHKLRQIRMNFTDTRIKTLNEMLSGIRMVKFYGWEQPFQRLLENIRRQELKYFIKKQYFSLIGDFIWEASPFLVSAASFTAYLMMADGNDLDPYKTFISLSLFEIIRFPLVVFPMLLSGLSNFLISLKRIHTFLIKEDLDDNCIESDAENTEIAVSLKDNVTLGWDKLTPTLSNLNLDIRKGKLIAVVGKVGAGKSSLLSGLLGEMHKLTNDGKIMVNGTVAFVPQVPWIQNASFKQNVLFCNECSNDTSFYELIIDACSLQPDIESFPAGDETEIGEKGINLSGGQKQRVSLARAIYCNADIYLLDDPLSAVDSHVGKQIFDRVIGPHGLLKNKTRLFATNSLQILPDCDQIIMLEEGRISEIGTYDQLKSSNEPFKEFIKTVVKNEEDEANKNPNCKQHLNYFFISELAINFH